MEDEYLDFIDQRDRDTKKVVSARVSEDVLNALNMAEEDSSSFGYSFSITSIIEKALNNTLNSVEGNSGINYYKLVKWQKKIKDAYHNFLFCIDFRNYTEEVANVLVIHNANPSPSYDLKKIPQIYANEPVIYRNSENYNIPSQIFKKMKQGKIDVQASINLHGNSIEDITTNLTEFIHTHSEHRFIRIIHGKGLKEDEYSPIKSLVIQYLKDHFQVLAFCSCPLELGGTGAVHVYIQSNPYFDRLNSRRDLLNEIDYVTGVIDNFDSYLQNREKNIVKQWNQALISQNSTYHLEIKGDRILFNDSIETYPEDSTDE